MGDGERAGRRDAIGELQTHLIVYAKGVADTIWEVQQAREYEEQKARGPLTARQELRSRRSREGVQRGMGNGGPSPQVAALRSSLLAKADRLDELIDALPDYPMDPACVPFSTVVESAALMHH
jgi:hypothetical protein